MHGLLIPSVNKSSVFLATRGELDAARARSFDLRVNSGFVMIRNSFHNSEKMEHQTHHTVILKTAGKLLMNFFLTL